MRIRPIVLSACIVMLPCGLQAQLRVPIDLTTGYIYNSSESSAPFRGAVIATPSYRVTSKITLGIPVGYVRADSVDAGIVGGQVEVCVLGCFLDLEVAFAGRVAGAPVGTPMVPLSLGTVFTFTAVRTGFMVTRDVKRKNTALELLFGVDLIALGDLFTLLFGGP